MRVDVIDGLLFSIATSHFVMHKQEVKYTACFFPRGPIIREKCLIQLFRKDKILFIIFCSTSFNRSIKKLRKQKLQNRLSWARNLINFECVYKAKCRRLTELNWTQCYVLKTLSCEVYVRIYTIFIFAFYMAKLECKWKEVFRIFQ